MVVLACILLIALAIWLARAWIIIAISAIVGGILFGVFGLIGFAAFTWMLLFEPKEEDDSVSKTS